MSVFGGDSWGREAQHRKRRVDDLMIEGIDSSVYKKLPNGKFVCVVCPSNPVLDSIIMLSTHVSGSRHQAAELRRQNRELAKQEEIKKRLALSDCVNAKAHVHTATKLLKSTSKPLIEQARKAVLEVISGDVRPEVKPAVATSPEVKPAVANLGVLHVGENGNNADPIGVVREVQPLYYLLHQERELKFTAAGWKRDCHGRWFKDENVEFDSDEDDPNIVLNGTA